MKLARCSRALFKDIAYQNTETSHMWWAQCKPHYWCWLDNKVRCTHIQRSWPLEQKPLFWNGIAMNEDSLWNLIISTKSKLYWSQRRDWEFDLISVCLTERQAYILSFNSTIHAHNCRLVPSFLNGLVEKKSANFPPLATVMPVWMAVW